MPAPLSRLEPINSLSSSTTSTMPHHDAYAPYDNTTVSSSSMFSFLAQQHWQSHQRHLFPINPYTHTPPPPIAHKVWILDCSSCAKFITNRGMKAVLLLHPNVALYSSDALPVNCSALTTNPDVTRVPSTCRTSSNPPRTCECLTQTLCCHGCGSTIGYMIVIPCQRCTSSITSTNRATNGHRFVFHSGQVTGTERHYIPDEPGVTPLEPVSFPLPPHGLTSSLDMHRQTQPFIPPFQSSPVTPTDYLPTPPLEFADLSPISSAHASPVVEESPLLPHARSTNERSVSPEVDLSYPSSQSISYGLPAEQTPQRKLNAGDLVYWHNLSRHGEIPGVKDDPRARKDTASPEKQFLFGR